MNAESFVQINHAIVFVAAFIFGGLVNFFLFLGLCQVKGVKEKAFFSLCPFVIILCGWFLAGFLFTKYHGIHLPDPVTPYGVAFFLGILEGGLFTQFIILLPVVLYLLVFRVEKGDGTPQEKDELADHRVEGTDDKNKGIQRGELSLVTSGELSLALEE